MPLGKCWQLSLGRLAVGAFRCNHSRVSMKFLVLFSFATMSTLPHVRPKKQGERFMEISIGKTSLIKSESELYIQAYAAWAGRDRPMMVYSSPCRHLEEQYSITHDCWFDVSICELDRQTCTPLPIRFDTSSGVSMRRPNWRVLAWRLPIVHHDFVHYSTYVY